MKKQLWFRWTLTGAALVAVCAAAWILIPASGTKDAEGADTLVSRRKLGREDLKARTASARRLSRERVAAKDERTREKPLLDFEDEEEKRLDKFQKEILEAIRRGMDESDLKSVCAAIAKMQRAVAEGKAKGLPYDKCFPSILREAAVQSLGWFGAEGIPELMSFLADPDTAIQGDAFEQLESALSDFSLSDRERALIVKQAATVLTDGDELDTLFMEICNMRNSVAADTIIDIGMNGTDQAKEKLPETVEMVTGEDNLTTQEDIQKWLQENPDDESDPEFYDGWKD